MEIAFNILLICFLIVSKAMIFILIKQNRWMRKEVAAMKIEVSVLNQKLSINVKNCAEDIDALQCDVAKL